MKKLGCDSLAEPLPDTRRGRFGSGSPAQGEGLRKRFEGSSLGTIKSMVASGLGVTVVPPLGVPARSQPCSAKPTAAVRRSKASSLGTRLAPSAAAPSRSASSI